MSGSYGQVLAIGASIDEVARTLGDERAYLVQLDDVIAVFSELAVVDAETVAIETSALIAGDVVGFAVSNDDVLACVLCRNGGAVAEVMVPEMEGYVGISSDELELMAEYLGETMPDSGNVSDPDAFVAAVGRGDAARAREILSDRFVNGGHISATDRHRALLAALALPVAVAGWDYCQFDNDAEGFQGPTPTIAGTGASRRRR